MTATPIPETSVYEIPVVENQEELIKAQNERTPIFVTNPGRECAFLEEYDCFYEDETDCYFVYNDDLSEPVMQYWLEGISSDYGWMEYDKREDHWYIEVNAGEWIVLQEKYNGDFLWHF